MLKGLQVAVIVMAAVLFCALVGTNTSFALSKQSHAAPGEVLDSNGDATTPTQFAGVFAYESTSTGVGTIKIQRSESGSANWVTIKTLTNTSAGDQRGYLYETFGDTDRSPGAYYKAVMSGNPSSGSFRFRFVK